jgi:hypothetical protein
MNNNMRCAMERIDKIKSLESIINKIKDPKQREFATDLLASVLELHADNGNLRERIIELEREIRTLNNANPVQGFLFTKNIVHFRKERGDEDKYDTSLEEEDKGNVFGHGPLEMMDEEQE